MSTPIHEIYDRFLKRIGKDTLTNLIAQGQIDVAEDVMMTYLEDAIVYFDTCKKELTIVDDEFIEDLDLEEKKILSRCMVLAWLEPKINTEGVIRGKVTPGDYTAKSPANLLDKLMKLRDAVDDEVNRMVNEYSFRGIDINE